MITVHILNVSQEGCTKNIHMPSTPLNGHRPGSNVEEREKAKHERDIKLSNSPQSKLELDGTKNIGPLGKPMAIQTKANVKQYDPELMSPMDLLDPKLAPNIVYLVWCGRRWFEFHHYMAVLSMIKYLKPDNIFFYYDTYPIQDYWLYNTWIEEIRDVYPFFHVELMEKSDYACADKATPNMTFIYRLLTNTGGIYINEHTILSDFPIKLRHYDFVDGLEPSTLNGLVLAKRGLPGYQTLLVVLGNPSLNTTQISCANVNSFSKARKAPYCVTAKNVFYPKDIWDTPTPFARHIRTLFYGRPDPVDAVPTYDELIPNIAHVVWIGGGNMDYLFYLGVLSLIYVAEAEAVFIHGNAPPSGPLWGRIKDHPKVRLIYRQTPGSVYGTRVNVLSHVTDVWRVDFMIRYGGIYVDTDTIFVKKLDHKIRGYDAVGSYDWTDWNPPFPDTINFGVAIGKRNATYWHEFQKSMKWFIDKDWSWNGLRQPYRIKERHPDYVKIDPHLQIICYQYKCRPTWWPGYHNESIHFLNTPSIKNWREDAYAFHWTLPTPPELEGEEALLSSTTMFGEIGRYVLEKAGLLNDLLKKYNINIRKHTDPPATHMNPQPPKIKHAENNTR